MNSVLTALAGLENVDRTLPSPSRAAAYSDVASQRFTPVGLKPDRHTDDVDD
jgi:hypothetical protein